MAASERAGNESSARVNARPYPESPADVFGCFWRHRRLVYQLARREVAGRYRGSYLGLAWSLFSPLLMLAVYTVVFGVIFKARWAASTTGSVAEFGLVLFTGLFVFGLFSECVNRAPSLVLSRANFVKRVVFPLEILPWVALLSSLFHAAVTLAVLLVAALVIYGSIAMTWPLIVVVLLPLLLFTLGVTWMLAALGVYVRDVAQTVGVITSALMFLSPVFYPVAAVPEKVRAFIEINPLTIILEQARDVLLWGRGPDLVALAPYLLGSIAIAWLGLVAFQRARVGFADVL
jgi:lipopolysaccharide transport system permease protein